MKTLLTSILLFACICACADTAKEDSDGIALFAVASLPQGVEEAYLGDSVIVTLTLYANVDFGSIDNTNDKVPSVKHATVRRYRADRRLNQEVAVYQGRRYYAVRAEQYAVTPDQLGELTFPAQKYDVVLSVKQRSRDPFDSFFPFGRTETRRVEKTCTSEPLRIKVIKRPRRTIEEMRRSGAVIM